MKVATIVGARPQFVKAAMLSRALKGAGQELLIHTGQHFDHKMSEVFFEEMGIPKPQYNLGIGGCSHGAMTGRMLEELEKIFLKEKPDWVVIFGDTNSTLAGVLAAVKLHIPVAHVEAGLRSFNRKMPEEINRIVADHCSDLLLTTSMSATKRLVSEGVSESKIVEVGDVMCDAALFYQKEAKQKSKILEQLNLKGKKFALATMHRQENTDDVTKLTACVRGLMRVAKHCPVVFPLHPRTKGALVRCGLLGEVKESLNVIEPVGYLDMLQLESHSQVILTDSGGVQKEAYFFNVPCLTLREETEWTELVEHGFNRLVPLEEAAIESAFHECVTQEVDWGKHLYGESSASEAIVRVLKKRL